MPEVRLRGGRRRSSFSRLPPPFQPTRQLAAAATSAAAACECGESGPLWPSVCLNKRTPNSSICPPPSPPPPSLRPPPPPAPPPPPLSANGKPLATLPTGGARAPAVVVGFQADAVVCAWGPCRYVPPRRGLIETARITDFNPGERSKPFLDGPHWLPGCREINRGGRRTTHPNFILGT